MASDYTISTSSPLTFGVGETSKTISLTIDDDTSDEGNETIEIKLGSPSGADLAAIDTHVITIVDDDAPPPTNAVPAVGGLISCYKAEGNADDETGKQPGVLVGGATANAAGFVGNNGFSFDGVNDHVRLTGEGHLSGEMTIEAWIFPRDSSAANIGMPIVSAGDADSRMIFAVTGSDNSTGPYQLYVDSGTQRSYTSNATIHSQCMESCRVGIHRKRPGEPFMRMASSLAQSMLRFPAMT